MCVCVCVCMYMLPVIEKDLLGLIEAFDYCDDFLPGVFQNSQMYPSGPPPGFAFGSNWGRGTENGEDYGAWHNGRKTQGLLL